MKNIPYERSLASHEKAKYFNISKNKIRPEDICRGNQNKYWFTCDKCHHEFLARPNDITNGRWCSYCSSKLLCDDKKCKICFEKSFASHPKSEFWDFQNSISSRKVFKGSVKKFKFKCGDCKHVFEMRPNDIIHGNQWCHTATVLHYVIN
jgi:DNA-directed RNA polymerase subunit RPC12/RpoP